MSSRSRLFAAALAASALLFCARPLHSQCTPAHPGCAGPDGKLPAIACITPPDVCSPLPVLFSVGLSKASANMPAWLVVGIDSAMPVIPIPSPPACGLGCALYYAPLVYLPRVTNASGEAHADFNLGCDPSLIGLTFDLQWWTLFPLFFGECLYSTPALHAKLF